MHPRVTADTPKEYKAARGMHPQWGHADRGRKRMIASVAACQRATASGRDAPHIMGGDYDS